MRHTLLLVITLLFALPAVFAQTKAGKTDTTKNAKFYTCPMHADVVSHQPGKCPTCGMELNASQKEKMKAGSIKNYTCSVHLDVQKHDPGKCPQCGRKLNLSSKEQMKAEVAKVYTCPMHPDVALNKDGKCPECGKALVEKRLN
jgi:transcription initiation factor IIE alpha subunit